MSCSLSSNHAYGTKGGKFTSGSCNSLNTQSNEATCDDETKTIMGGCLTYVSNWIQYVSVQIL
jgi:hypothetical protein